MLRALAVSGQDEGPAPVPGGHVGVEGGFHVRIGRVEGLPFGAVFRGVQDGQVRLAVVRGVQACGGRKDSGLSRHDALDLAVGGFSFK
ncbi:hypothetical protein SDC9_52490 [bioreactor metagenome]|uniref:Uncharacterized protein n=1 Tax=bioreactor metagenome TaxID=1076179 RepID=A0A644WVW5_9ZZZZ